MNLNIYLILGVAIIAEVIATTALAASETLTRLVPSLIAIVGYVFSFWLLSMTFRVLPTGIVYAIWSGCGIVLISAVAWIWGRQPLDYPALIGISMIIGGVVIVNLFSKSLPH